VVWADRKTEPAKSFDDLLSRVSSQKSEINEKFARSVQQTRNQREILDKKFEEARRRAAEKPNERPPNPFDNE
jgi:molecular chaperone GrpE (heat shock protein)